MKLTEALDKVWSAIGEIENIDFDQTGEEIKHDLLGQHRYYNVDGVVDQVNNCLQELQTTVDQYQRIEEDVCIELLTFCKALVYGIWIKCEFGDKNAIIHVFPGIYRAGGRILGFVIPPTKWQDKDGNVFGVNRCFYEQGATWALTKDELL